MYASTALGKERMRKVAIEAKDRWIKEEAEKEKKERQTRAITERNYPKRSWQYGRDNK